MNKKEGLTIIELLVTISIIASTIVVVLVLGDRTVSQSNLFALNTQATFLAKEGMELLSDDIIRTEIRSEITEGESPVYFEIKYDGELAEKAESNCGRMMKINPSGFYGFGGPETSLFSRCITIWTNNPMDNELRVRVKTDFDYSEKEYSVELYRIFYD